MAERYLVKEDKVAEGVTVPESIKAKLERDTKLAEEKAGALKEKKKQVAEQRVALKKRTIRYEKEYKFKEASLIKMRRQAKVNGSFFVEPEEKLLFVVRIVGIMKVSPKPRKVMQLLRLRQLHNGVFLKVNKPILNMLKIINPYVTYGYPTRKMVKELIYKRGYAKVNKQRIPLVDNEIISNALGEKGLHGMEDLIHEIYTVGPHFKEASNFLWPFKLNPPRGGFRCKRHGFHEIRGGDWGNRQELINKLVDRML